MLLLRFYTLEGFYLRIFWGKNLWWTIFLDLRPEHAGLEKVTQKYNPPKSNMSTKSQWLEDVCPIETAPFKGTC